MRLAHSRKAVQTSAFENTNQCTIGLKLDKVMVIVLICTMALTSLKAYLSSGDLTEEDIWLCFSDGVDMEGRINYDMDRCWKWTKCIGINGYGALTISRISLTAHRLSWWLHNGTPEMTSDMVVRHKCDNKECTNPAHLEIGTQIDNIKDAFDRKRINNRKLSDDDILEMKIKRTEGMMVKDIASVYGISVSHTSLILNGKTKRTIG